LIKFADDTAMLGLITNDDDSIFQQQLAMFVNYCDANFLELNVSKTKEMVIDYRTTHVCKPSPITIKGSEVERVTSYKYLGIVIDEKLSWHLYIDSLIKRLNTRMYCMRKLNYFHVNQRIIALFYQSIVASIWKYCMLAWGGNIAVGDRERLQRVVNEAGRIIGSRQQSFNDAYDDMLDTQLTKLIKDSTHPLHERLVGQLNQRSGRMRLPSAVTGRYLSSFIPQVIKHHNSLHRRGVTLIDL
jgi:hypothetical protein